MRKNKMIFAYGIPIIFSIIFFILELNKIDTNSWLIFLNVLFNSLIYPIIFAVCITLHCIVNKKRFVLFHSVIMSLIEILCVYLGYLSWGIVTGEYHNPDSETILIINFQWQSALLIIWIYSIVLQLIFFYRKKK